MGQNPNYPSSRGPLSWDVVVSFTSTFPQESERDVPGHRQMEPVTCHTFPLMFCNPWQSLSQDQLLLSSQYHGRVPRCIIHLRTGTKSSTMLVTWCLWTSPVIVLRMWPKNRIPILDNITLFRLSLGTLTGGKGVGEWSVILISFGYSVGVLLPSLITVRISFSCSPTK